MILAVAFLQHLFSNTVEGRRSKTFAPLARHTIQNVKW